MYWRKSSFSVENGSCVEVALTGPVVGVRDSKSPATGHLTLTAAAWSEFVGVIMTSAGRLQVGSR